MPRAFVTTLLACGVLAMPAAAQALTADDLVKLKKMGLSDALIMAAIDDAGGKLKLSPKDMATLKKRMSPAVVAKIQGAGMPLPTGAARLSGPLEASRYQPVSLCWRYSAKKPVDFRLELTIAANGRVTRAMVSKGNFARSKTRDCIEGLAKSWRFRPAPSTTTVSLSSRLTEPPVLTLAGKDSSAGTFVPGPPKVRGAIDKEVIRRVIRQHRKKVRYCYEKELKGKATLAGKVVVKFTIDRSGNVTSAAIASSELRDDKVERCLLGHVRSMVFPKPRGGGIVIVNYPLYFRPVR